MSFQWRGTTPKICTLFRDRGNGQIESRNPSQRSYMYFQRLGCGECRAGTKETTTKEATTRRTATHPTQQFASTAALPCPVDAIRAFETPSIGVLTRNVIGENLVASLHECARHCLATANCAAFSHRPSSGTNAVCRLNSEMVASGDLAANNAWRAGFQFHRRLPGAVCPPPSSSGPSIPTAATTTRRTIKVSNAGHSFQRLLSANGKSGRCVLQNKVARTQRYPGVSLEACKSFCAAWWDCRAFEYLRRPQGTDMCKVFGSRVHDIPKPGKGSCYRKLDA